MIIYVDIYIITPKIRSAILFPGWAPFSHLQLQPACGEPRGDFASKLPTSLLSPPPEPDPPGYEKACLKHGHFRDRFFVVPTILYKDIYDI